MPSKKSHRTSVKNAEYNRPIASRAKTLLRNSIELIEENKDKDQIQKSYKEAISALDKASLIDSSLSLIESNIGFQAYFFNRKINPIKIRRCQKNKPKENSFISFSIFKN